MLRRACLAAAAGAPARADDIRSSTQATLQPLRVRALVVMIFGHAGMAVLGRKLGPFSSGMPVFLVFSFGPDLLDKSARLLFSMPGRGFAHSFLCLLVVCLLVLALRGPLKRLDAWLGNPLGLVSDSVLATALFLWLSHLLLDAVPLEVFFWPFLGPLPPPEAPWSFFQQMKVFYLEQTPFSVFILDAALCAGAFLSLLLPARRSPKSMSESCGRS